MSERIETAALRDFSVSLCRAAGLSADDAALLTDSILFAECRGVTSHGLLRLPQYIARLRSGATASNVPMPFTMESGGTARLDAQNGLGQLAGRKASDKAEELAAEYGVKMDEAVSDKLLIASAMIETLPEKSPIANFATNNNIFVIRPKIPAIMPFLVRSCPLIIFCSFDTFSLPLFFILV